MSELLDALTEARQVWRRVERAAAELDDDELQQRIAITRLAILDTRERAEDHAREASEVAL